MIRKFIAIICCLSLFSITLTAQAPPQVNFEDDDALFKQVEENYNQNKFEDCILTAEDHINKYPFSVHKMNALLYQGLSLIKLNRIQEARIIFEDLDLSYPHYEKNDKIKYTLAKLYLKIGDKESADMILNNLVELYPNSEYAEKAKGLSDNVKQEIKQEEEKEEQEEKKLDALDTEYSFTKISWTKITAGAFLLTAPVLYLIGDARQKDADNIYNIQYLNTDDPVLAQQFYDNANKASEEATLYKNLAIGAAGTAVGLLVLDYFFFGRIPVIATADQHSYNIQLKIRF